MVKLRNILIITFVLIFSATIDSFGQRNGTTINQESDKYSMSIDSKNKPKLSYYLIRLKGDKGLSIIDLEGNIISRNFTPFVNSNGKIYGENWTTPVIDDIFCIERSKKINDGKWRHTHTVYQNASNPTPIPGLTDLYSANIINPNLFPISKYGERIKFVDKKGNVKFTVMPIDGKEPSSVYPFCVNGIFIVNVTYDVETEADTDQFGNTVRGITKETEKYGAINTKGEWVVYPEFDYIGFYDYSGAMVGYKGKDRYIIKSGKTIRDTRFDNFDIDWDSPIKGDYIIETFRTDRDYTTNVYDLQQNYITTIDNADYIRPNHVNPNIFCVRRNFYSYSQDCHDNLIDLSRGNAVISKDYQYLEELPNGDYIGYNYNTVGEKKCWYVRANGIATTLPDGCKFPIKNPGMALIYDTKINRLFVKENDSTPGYICDLNGTKIGNLQIEEYYNSDWEAEPVKSSYWRKNILGEDD